MKVESIAIDQLTLDPLNARKHPPRSIDAIAESVKRFGQRKPVVLFKNTVIAGNGMLLAARKLKMKELWITRFDDEAKARAYAVADNRTAELSAWDEGQLVEGLEALRADGMDLAALGFSDKEFEEFKKAAGLVESNNASFASQINFKLAYELVFETHEEQQKFYDAIRLLNKMRGETTVAARLLAHLTDTLKER